MLGGSMVTHLPQGRRSSILRLAAAAAPLLLSLRSQHAHDVVEGLFDVDAVLGRRLDELAAELAGQGVTFLRRDLAFRDAVALVADQHYRDVSDTGWPRPFFKRDQPGRFGVCRRDACR